MPQSYTPEFKKKLSVSIWKRDAPTKALLQNTAYQKPVFLNGAVNSVKNVRPKPSQTRKAKTRRNSLKKISDCVRNWRRPKRKNSS